MLRVGLAGHYLNLLDRLERRAHLRAKGRPSDIVRVVAAIQRDSVVLTGLAADNNRVVPQLVGWCELNTWQQPDRRKIAAVHRGELAQIRGRDVAAHLGARQVDQGRGAPDCEGFLKRSNLESEVDRQGGTELQFQPGPFERAEAHKLADDAVVTGSELRGKVAAVRAAAGLTKNPGIFIRQDDDDAGQHTAVLVDDTAPDFRGGLLRGNRCSQRHEHHRDYGFEEQRSHLRPFARLNPMR
jgi:hypothetical protein